MVAYADSLHITVIPEIEMPGHSEEVLAVYPELSCAGKPYVYDDLCIGNDKTFEFLENVLTEVMELFRRSISTSAATRLRRRVGPPARSAVHGCSARV